MDKDYVAHPRREDTSDTLYQLALAAATDQERRLARTLQAAAFPGRVMTGIAPLYIDQARAIMGDPQLIGLIQQTLQTCQPSRFRHLKRGSTYAMIGYLTLQVEPGRVLRDGEKMMGYRADDDGSLWARAKDEFEDGRFENLP